MQIRTFALTQNPENNFQAQALALSATSNLILNLDWRDKLFSSINKQNGGVDHIIQI